MDNTTVLVSSESVQAVNQGQTIGLVLTAVALLIVIILGSIAVVFLYLKLKQHEADILRLQNPENPATELRTSDGNSHSDSAIEMGSIERGSDSYPVDETRSRSRSSWKPKFSVKIGQEKANVYGCTPQTSQLIGAVQDYYKATTGVVVAPETVSMLDKDENTRDRRSNVFTGDWKTGRTTSMLLDNQGELSETNITNNKALFVHKTIDGSGGNLEVSGVTLVIPKGALSHSTLITLGVVWEEKFYPSLSKKQSLLSPIVLCQPCGLNFNVPATLTFPHCAQNVNDDWRITVLKRGGYLGDSTDWVLANFNDFNELNITGSEVILKLNHFTLYTCVGESKENKTAAKSVHLVAFTSPPAAGKLFKPRIYCVNNYKTELQDVESMVKKMAPGARISETSDLLVHDTEEDLVVNLAELSPKDRWNLQGNKSEVLSFELVWHCLSPHVTFLMRPRDARVRQIYCDFSCYQRGRENLPSSLKIAEERTKSLSPLASCTECPEQELINEVVILLDPENECGDWRDLAEKLGCDLARIKWLGTQDSPTKVLIDAWLEENRNFSELAEKMIEINRLDVADEIRKRFTK